MSSLLPVADAVTMCLGSAEGSVVSTEQETQTILDQFAKLFGPNQASAVHKEIKLSPERYLEDERPMYKNLAHLEIKRVSELRAGLAADAGSQYEAVLHGIRKCIEEECSWLCSRFKYIYHQLRNGDIRVKNQSRSSGIGIYSFGDMKAASDYGLQYCDREAFMTVTSDLEDFIVAENQSPHAQPILSQLIPPRPHCHCRGAGEQVFSQVSFQIILEASKVSENPPLALGELSAVYELEQEVESLKRCRRALVTLNNIMVEYTKPEVQDMGRGIKSVVGGLPKSLELPECFRTFSAVAAATAADATTTAATTKA